MLSSAAKTHIKGVTVELTLNDTQIHTHTDTDSHTCTTGLDISLYEKEKSWITIAHCVMCTNQECFRSLEVINLRSHTESLETDVRLTF